MTPVEYAAAGARIGYRLGGPISLEPLKSGLRWGAALIGVALLAIGYLVAPVAGTVAGAIALVAGLAWMATRSEAH